MEKREEECDFTRSKLVTYTYYPIRSRLNRVIGKVLSFTKRKDNGKEKYHSRSGPALDLQPGDLVEVLPEDQIMETLDGQLRCMGLSFTNEMKRYCGKRFRVLKKVERIMLESTGELRQMRSPTVFLEGAICEGEYHGKCDRMCYLMWREAWLRKVPEIENMDKST